MGAAALALAAQSGCGDERGPEPNGQRANAVTAATATPASSPSGPSTGASSAPSARPRRAELCTRRPESAAPKAELERAAAPGVPALPAKVAFGAGKWIWVNVWAAWCVPCKQEIPLVRRFEAALRKAGVSLEVAFVSLDDDERELQRFLVAQPDGGVRASYWLPEGAARKTFLGALGVGTSATLPLQAFYDPKGELACLVEDVVEESDYAGIAKLVGAR
ncbi:MAG: TlpA family protein disulfide reductase [Polyangiaceae bacterium]|nr:TlpA family protein disulfide reductase [Polyangiaceae bacterium]